MFPFSPSGLFPTESRRQHVAGVLKSQILELLTGGMPLIVRFYQSQSPHSHLGHLKLCKASDTPNLMASRSTMVASCVNSVRPLHIRWW